MLHGYLLHPESQDFTANLLSLSSCEFQNVENLCAFHGSVPRPRGNWHCRFQRCRHSYALTLQGLPAEHC